MITPWQSTLISELNQLFRQHRLPHGVLIDLGQGHNAEQFIIMLLQTLLCESLDSSACGHCGNCTLVKGNNYPDVTLTTLVENEKTGKLNKDIKIDQLRRLIHQLSLTDNRGQGKIAVIYPAERMNLAAANSLLKTLEEPSDNAYLFILSHHPARLPITIRSRCQIWLVPRAESQQATEWLIKQGIEEQRAENLLHLSNNDPVLAQEMAEQQYDRHYQSFNVALGQFVDGQQDVASTVSQIDTSNPVLTRQLWRHYLTHKLQQMAIQSMDNGLKAGMQAILDLQRQSIRQLMSEENNLNLQLQLEDVLISLKQILNR